MFVGVGVCVCETWVEDISEDSLDSKKKKGMEVGQSGEKKQSVYLQNITCIFLFAL